MPHTFTMFPLPTPLAPPPLNYTQARNRTSCDSESSAAQPTFTFLRNHRTNCQLAPFSAHSSVFLISIAPSALCIDHHRGSSNLVTLYSTKGGPLHAKSTSFLNPTPTTMTFLLFPPLIHLPQLLLPYLLHRSCLTPNMPHVLPFQMMTYATVYHLMVTEPMLPTLRLLS
jgi:hypothetical protein